MTGTTSRSVTALLTVIVIVTACGAASTAPASSPAAATPGATSPLATLAPPSQPSQPSPTPTPAAARTGALTPAAPFRALPTRAPKPTSGPTATPKLIAGWPSASRAGVAMFGKDDDIYVPMVKGRLGLSVRVTGLPPGEVLTVVATGKYNHAWFCGSQPEHTFLSGTEGTAKDSGRAVAGSDGTVTIRVELVAKPPDQACPTHSEAPWASVSWSKVRITDAVHRIALTPPEVITGP